MDAAKRKELRNAYKTRPVTGGVCCIRCSGNQRLFLQSTTNIEGLKNRYEFSMTMGCAPDPSMRDEWLKYGAGAFSFTVLEELKKGETQTEQDFADDIDTLYEIWLEKYQSGELK